MFMSKDQFYDTSDDEGTEDDRREICTDEEKKVYKPAFHAFMEKNGKQEIVSSSTVRPVSARTFRKSTASVRSVRMFDNDLFGDDGDILAVPDNEMPSSSDGNSLRESPDRTINSSHKRSKTSTAERRRFERLKGGICVSSTTLMPSTKSSSDRHPFGSGEISAYNDDTEKSGQGSAVHVHSTGATGVNETASMEKNLKSEVIETILDSRESPKPTKFCEILQSQFDSCEELSRADREDFLLAPGPTTSPILCFIVRDRNDSKMYPKYSLYLDEGGKFLISSRKRKKSKSSNYLISLDDDDLTRESPNYFGKVRSNFFGTEFILFDHGSKPVKNAKLPKTDGDQTGDRIELGGVVYQHNVLGTRGPRRMTALLPVVNCDDGERVKFLSDKTIIDRFKASEDLEKIVIMKNKTPKWNEQLNAYCLNFKGRVTEASVKNFQLVTDEDPETVILQFGKVGKDTFTMDYSWPICALQAFMICMTSFDNKLACE